ncbi:MAG: alpha/beta hydrolase [Actinomycetes bacterium]|nr:alpha/beta hydrolase [Actinomycetes bacterium]MDX5380930.1 alpha/beta hydrolase [Actinomycetes bacterium]MDX5400034.1 alpha/beta hydrolase [Actinomycetes bacterium]MDX5450690.1 alpha/beta hydrolase [Actinomycetes bacterium]
MTSWQTHAVALILRATRKNPVVVRRARADPLTRASAAAPPPRRLRDRVEVERVAGVDVVRVRPAPSGGGAVPGCAAQSAGGAAPSGGGAAPSGGGALVHFHGGAFRSGIARQHWNLIGELADATGRDVWVPRYGLLPKHTADDALALLAALADRLREVGRVHVLGDSAGGNLALLAVQSWGESGTGPEVVGVTLIAPWLDLSLSNPRIPAVERVDPWLDPESVRPLGVAWAAGRDTQDPAVSPLFGRLTGLPPMAVLVGTRDVCLPDCELLAARVPGLRMRVEEGSPHVFPLLPTPEGRAGRAAIARFVRETFAGA